MTDSFTCARCGWIHDCGETPFLVKGETVCDSCFAAEIPPTPYDSDEMQSRPLSARIYCSLLDLRARAITPDMHRARMRQLRAEFGESDYRAAHDRAVCFDAARN